MIDDRLVLARLTTGMAHLAREHLAVDHAHVVGRGPHLAGTDAMMVAVVGFARERSPVFARTRLNQRTVELLGLRLVHEIVNEPHRFDHSFQILGMFEHAGIDAHQLVRVGALKEHPAAVALLKQMRRYR